MALLYAHTPTLILKVRPAASLSIFSRNCNFFCFKFIGKLFNQYHMLTYHTTGLTTTKSSSHNFFRNWVLVIESAVSKMSRKGIFMLKCVNRYFLEMALPITKLILKKIFNRNYPQKPGNHFALHKKIRLAIFIEMCKRVVLKKVRKYFVLCPPPGL